jgi:glycosyltransferase involved in cell wall biosynthesis
MGKLRVAIVAPSLGILGGQAVQAARLLDAWRGDPDVEAWLVPVNPRPPGWLGHAVAVKYLRTIATELTYLPLLVRELSRADVAHVFSASYTSFLLAPLPALMVARALGRPAVLNYHSGEAPDHLKRSAVARAAIARADRTVVPSRFLVDVFHAFGLHAQAIPNLIDLDRFRFRDRDPLRPRLLSTRNFERLYDVATTLRAFQIVERRHPDATLTLVGSGREERALRSLASALGLKRVRFAGRVPPGGIAAVYAAHDLYIQSPTIDNAPLSVIEAFASGLPVVSTDAGGVPVLVRHGREGLLAPAGDHEALAAHVSSLLERPAFARRLARRARAGCERHTWPAVRHEWLSLYRGVARAALRPQPAPAQLSPR